jgi:hypothetical protein
MPFELVDFPDTELRAAIIALSELVRRDARIEDVAIDGIGHCAIRSVESKVTKRLVERSKGLKPVTDEG